jgi:hypothetical protein
VSVVEGPRGGRCLHVADCPPRRAAVQAQLARLLAALGRQPTAVQTDRGACFVGADAAAALPGRLTLWLWGLGIAHRLIPPGRPQRNGAVERFHGALAHSWAGEAGGREALVAVWNAEKAPARAAAAYAGRAGFADERVWAGLAGVRVERRVDRQGKLSLWDRPVRVGRAAADRPAVVTFDAAERRAVVRDERGARLAEVGLPWLTADWLWADVPVTDHASESGVTSIER